MTIGIERLCVYCGSSPGNGARYADAASSVAEALVTRNIELVYGGASKGIMGVIADRVLALGGKVHGVIPQQLVDKEIAHDGLTKQHVVASMHERKMLMAALADGFIALPGGFGTLEEIVEITTWAQLRFHAKPCGLLNVDGFYDRLLEFLDNAMTEGFIPDFNRRMLLADECIEGLLARFERYEPPDRDKWTD